MKQFEGVPDPTVNINLVVIHGIYSEGSELEKLANKVSSRLAMDGYKIHITNINYPKTFISTGRFRSRRETIGYAIGGWLAACSYKFPNARTTVIAHSLGTECMRLAMVALHGEFRLNNLILVGSIIKRNFDWFPFTGTNIHNFIGKKDKVVWFSRVLWGMVWNGGRSGIKGFKTKSPNLVQYEKEWNHTQYPEGIEDFIKIVKNDYERRPLEVRLGKPLKFSNTESIIKHVMEQNKSL